MPYFIVEDKRGDKGIPYATNYLAIHAVVQYYHQLKLYACAGIPITVASRPYIYAAVWAGRQVRLYEITDRGPNTKFQSVPGQPEIKDHLRPSVSFVE